MFKKILITGGAGFIGSNLIKLLLKNGIDISIIDNFTTGKMENIKEFISDIKIFKGDLLDLSLLKKSLKNIEAVVHLAAIPSVVESIKNPIKVNSNNILSTIALFDMISKKTNISKIIQASSSAVYGESDCFPIKENFKKNPLSPYAIDKYSQELYASFFSKQYNVNIISLRFFNVFGQKQDPASMYAGVIPIFVDNLKKNKNLTIFGNGKSIRDFIYVEDVVNSIYLSLITKLENHIVFNVGTGKITTIKELAKLIMFLLKKQNKIIYKPSRNGEIYKSLSSIDKIKKQLNFNPEYSLKKGLSCLLNII